MQYIFYFPILEAPDVYSVPPFINAIYFHLCMLEAPDVYSVPQFTNAIYFHFYMLEAPDVYSLQWNPSIVTPLKKGQSLNKGQMTTMQACYF